MAVLQIFSSVILVSLISLIGLFLLPLKKNKMTFLLLMVSFSAGAMFGDAFLHLLPESGVSVESALLVLVGILFNFVVEKIILWRHCHSLGSDTKKDCHPFVWMNLLGDGVHNFIDGIIIASSYLISIPVGYATTLAVILHEIPQEAGDFAVLIHGGLSKSKALFFNFLTALTAILGAGVALLLNSIQHFLSYSIPFAAGCFIYVAGTDLIPELHKETTPKKSLAQFFFFVLGIAVMALLLMIE